MGTIIHEILHACKGCRGHQGQWRRYADTINSKYPQYNITRTTSAENFGLEDTRKADKKYAIKCVDCGHIYYREKYTAIIQKPENYRCKCGGKLERIDVRDIKAEVKTPTPSVSGQLCLLDM